MDCFYKCKIEEKLNKHLNEMFCCFNQSKNIKVILDDESEENDKCYATQDGIIYIGLNSPLIHKQLKKFQNTYRFETIVEGIAIHETGHVIYSNYLIIKENETAFENLYTQLKVLTNQYSALENSKINKTKLLKLFEDYIKASIKPIILNFLEDGAIEYSLINDFPLSKRFILYTRYLMTEEYKLSLKNK